MRASYRPAGPARRLAACRVRVLPRLPVHLDGQRELSRVRYLVRRGQPRPEHAVRVGRLAQAPLLGSADRHVEADAIAGDAAGRELGAFRNMPALWISLTRLPWWMPLSASASSRCFL